MSLRLGFAIPSHANNSALGRLVARLNLLYGDPPIAIHHDFSQAALPLDEAALGPNVYIVRPHLPTRWGHISIVQAALAAIEGLQQRFNPDWVTLLSTVCYPVAPAETVLNALSLTPHDAFVGHVQLYPNVGYPTPTGLGEFMVSPTLPTHTSDIVAWIDHCRERYVVPRQGLQTFGQFSKLYAGDLWFTANAKVAMALFTSGGRQDELLHYFADLVTPCEAYFQTTLCNRLNLSNRRYANWLTPRDHPLDLTLADVPVIKAAGCWFARKLAPDPDPALLHALDSCAAGGEAKGDV